MTNEIKVLDKGFVRLVDVMGNDNSIVQAAKVSYQKHRSEEKYGSAAIDDAGKNLIRYLYRHKHTTPFEMVEFKFHCKMPIFVARQWIRHRTASVNEVSGRYTELKDEFYVPELEQITRQSSVNKQGGSAEVITDPQETRQAFENGNLGAFAEYEEHLERGTRKELARICLPLSTYTEWYWKIDLHNLLHFLSLRMDSHAQYEIRVFAEAMYELIKPIVPVAVQAFDDYHPYRNARTLSAMEQKLLGMCIVNSMDYHVAEYDIEGEIEKLGMTKREQDEFWSWYNNLVEKL